MRKENFGLKLKIFFLSDRLSKLAPEHIQDVLKEVNLCTGSHLMSER